jgi:Rieske Fe-S protein
MPHSGDDMATDHEPANRRSFLAWTVTGLGAVFSAILGAPVVAFVIDPRNRQGASGDFRIVDMIPLSELEKDKPVQGVLRAVRRDGWTLHPNDVIGRVWIILKKPPPAEFPNGADPTLLDIYTTICPHLGCSVNMNADQVASSGFTCPCHGAQFNLDGTRKAPASNPAARSMDSLEWEITPDPANPERKVLQVKYLNFKSSIKEPVKL